MVSSFTWSIFKGLVIVGLIAVFAVLYIIFPPQNFPTNTLFTIHNGDTISTVAHELKDDHLIHSVIAFRIMMAGSGTHAVVAGDYYINKPSTVIAIAHRTMDGDYDLTPSKITIPEGSTIRQIAAILSNHFPTFDSQTFLALAETKEGYLFPDTYFFLPNVKPEDVMQLMSVNFDNKIASSSLEIAHSGHSLSDIITMASILEEEANTAKDWGLISGILWKRLENNMPLQVDSTMSYSLNKPSSELTSSDLKIESLYNTYLNKGLPPTPISNPGLATILAAAEPVESPYWYYISDSKGTMHYAATLDEQNANIAKYLSH